MTAQTVEALRVEPGEPGVCPACKGAGTVRVMTSHLGPDDYEYDEECEACHGTGSADLRDAIKALPYQPHTVKPHTEMVSRALVLRLIEAHATIAAAEAQPESLPAEPVELTPQAMKRGGRYNWKGQPDRLIYLRRFDGWHQFNKIGDPREVWCEVLDGDLSMLEETAAATPPLPVAAVPAPSACACPCCRQGIEAPHEYHLERRPMAHGQQTQNMQMWAVHVQGPDDIHACLDRATADALALVLNRQFERHKHPDDPPMKAEVVAWPYGYEEWRAAAEQLRFEARSHP